MPLTEHLQVRASTEFSTPVAIFTLSTRPKPDGPIFSVARAVTQERMSPEYVCNLLDAMTAMLYRKIMYSNVFPRWWRDSSFPADD
jgi:hypothetical protein